MQALLVLLALYLLVALFVLPIWTMIRFGALKRMQEDLTRELASLARDVRKLSAAQPEPPSAPAPKTPVATPAVVSIPPPPVVPPVPEWWANSASSVPPPLPETQPEPPVTLGESPLITESTRESLPPDEAPPVDFREIPAAARTVPTPPPSGPTLMESINWEQFMGAKLFAWLGGLALFLAVAFFVKYSFEHDLIPPAVRVAIGFLVGAGLVVGGLRIPREKYAITAQTLIASGIVSLYAVTFACRSIYHFEFFGPVPTFLLMSLITATAFILAVRLDAQVVAILGILGGFLTPVLLSTGVDNPAALFGYIAVLNLGLVAVTLHRRWFYLVPLGAAGTVLMMIGWAGQFYVPGKTVTAMVVCLGFSALYFVVYLLARRWHRATPPVLWAAVGLPGVALAFALFFMNHRAVGANPGLLFLFILASDGLLLALAWLDDRLPKLHLVAGLTVFGLLSVWTAEHLTGALLPWALAMYLVFAALHTVFPLVLERKRPAAAPTWWSQMFPPLALLLMLLPIFRLETVSFFLWPAILLVDLIAVGLAVLSASMLAVAAVLVLTLAATGLSLFRVPVAAGLDLSLLLVIGGFAVFFFAASLWLARRIGAKLPAADRQMSDLFGDPRAQLPAFAALLPFLLLIMACARLPVPDPSAVFGLGLLLVVLTLGLARILLGSDGKLGTSDSEAKAGDERATGVEWLPACALAGLAALELVWHSRHFDPAAASGPLAWYVGFYAVFAVYPFFFRRDFARLTGPWAVAASSGLAHFWMVYQAIKTGWPNSENFLGAVPALFVLAPLGSLVVILRTVAADNPKRLNQLAWFGGVALFFITLIFPIQFERQWLTVAWALEGVALLWMFHRVPHPALRATGAVLLVIAFVRLALNPAVLGYHVRGDIGILNWYLYAYGLATAALFTGAWLLAPPRQQVLGINAPPILNTLGAVLAFLLLNLEIADYFTAPGAFALAFNFSGDFARDMSYTIGWALFALALLGAGIWHRTKAARYAAIALLSVALFKLFFHDLASLEALYRIGALLAVAVIAMLASFAYQRFLPSNEKAAS